MAALSEMPSRAPAGRGAWLAPAVHAVAIEADLVFLDLRADAYACLADVGSRVDFDPSRRWLRVADRALAAELASQGLIVATPAPPRVTPRPWSGPPGRSVLPETSEPLRAEDLTEMARSLWDLFRAYRGRPLPALLAAAAPPCAAAPPDPTAALLADVGRFHRWSPYAPVSGKCLLRSFLLLRGLRRAGHDAQWVFGVSTWPFMAHCWLQAGDTVLDDTFERVAGYTPILVL